MFTNEESVKEDVYSSAEIVFELIFVIEKLFDEDVPEENLEPVIEPFEYKTVPDPFEISIVDG